GRSANARSRAEKRRVPSSSRPLSLPAASLTRTTRTSVPGKRRSFRSSSALERALADLPRRRIAGVIAVTDGQIHDAPDSSTWKGATTRSTGG
ncbi:MAG TPA: hypothetical protein VNB28_06940, partial [Methylomirabilota bacterium]|nr:hypothetical protein [Methylomirabilota bacterium]